MFQSNLVYFNEAAECDLNQGRGWLLRTLGFNLNGASN